MRFILSFLFFIDIAPLFMAYLCYRYIITQIGRICNDLYVMALDSGGGFIVIFLSARHCRLIRNINKLYVNIQGTKGRQGFQQISDQTRGGIQTSGRHREHRTDAASA